MVGNLNRQKANKSELQSLVIFFGILAIFYMVFVLPQIDDFQLSDQKCEELNRLWLTKYQDDFDFSAEWPIDEFDCLSEDSGMARALHFLDTLIIEPPEGEPAVDFYEWAKSLKPRFNKRIMRQFAGYSFLENNQIDLNAITLGQNNPVQIAGIIIHELRHLEEGYNSHVPCKNNPLLTCDALLEEQPQQGGAYNYNVYFYHQVRQFSNASSYEKKLARQLMQTTFDEKINSTSANDRQRYDVH